MITANAAGVIKAAMSKTRSRLAAITLNKLEAVIPGNRAATMARLRRLNAKSTDLRRVGKRSLHDRLLPRKRPLIARIQEFRALKNWLTGFSINWLCRREFIYSDISIQVMGKQ